MTSKLVAADFIQSAAVWQLHIGLKVLTTNARLAEILEPANAAIIAAWKSEEGDGFSGTAAGSALPKTRTRARPCFPGD